MTPILSLPPSLWVRAVPYKALHATLAMQPTAALVSICGPEDGYAPVLPTDRPVLRLCVSDIDTRDFPDAAQARACGLVLATAHDIADTLAFARKHATLPLVVHCTAGISRSPALALAVLADRAGGAALSRVRTTFAQTHPLTMPNPHLLALADALLDLPTPLADLLSPGDTRPFSW